MAYSRENLSPIEVEIVKHFNDVIIRGASLDEELFVDSSIRAMLAHLIEMTSEDEVKYCIADLCGDDEDAQTEE